MASLSSTWRAACASRSLKTATTSKTTTTTTTTTTTRHYAKAAPSFATKLARESDRAARLRESNMSSQPSMSQMQKRAQAELFRDGGGPLFPVRN
ncbi:hypothetical protein E4U41_001179 [Claviceps citrina]|nr:hypothetical protein E4U41_001179 [Claviceps citrina]